MHTAMVILACVGLFMVLYGLTVIVKRRSQAKRMSASAAPPTAKTTARDLSPLIFPEGKIEVAPRPVALAKTTVRSGKPAGRPVRSSASSSTSSGGRRSDDHSLTQGALLGHMVSGSHHSDNSGHSHHSGTSGGSSCGSSGGSSCGGGGGGCGGGGGT